MRLSWVCVDVSQIVTVRPMEYGINSLCFDVAMCELWSAGHSAEILPVGALICLNVGLAPQHEMTMRWSLPTRGLWLPLHPRWPGLSDRCCCPRFERIHHRLPQFGRLAASISLSFKLRPNRRVLLLVCALQYQYPRPGLAIVIIRKPFCSRDEPSRVGQEINSRQSANHTLVLK